MSKNRIEWVDVFKFLGILAIFCGHLGRDTGHLYNFVFMYHVPMFFFSSGLFAGKLCEFNFGEVIKKKFHHILKPYIYLVVVNMTVIILLNEADFITCIKYIKQFIWGIRNQLPAAGMWFFSCLFCTTILFDLLRRILKRKTLLLLVSAAIYFASITLFANRPDATPSLFFNIDSACYYLIYYTIGYIASDALINSKFKRRTIRNHIPEVVGIVCLSAYICTVYMEQDFLGNAILTVLPMGEIFYPVLRAMLIIEGNILMAKLLTGNRAIGYIGAHTLWLCGNESVAKHMVKALAGILGFSIEINNALAAIVYAVVLILFIIYILMPMEKAVYNKCISYIGVKGEKDKNDNEAV